MARFVNIVKEIKMCCDDAAGSENDPFFVCDDLFLSTQSGQNARTQVLNTVKTHFESLDPNCHKTPFTLYLLMVTLLQKGWICVFKDMLEHCHPSLWKTNQDNLILSMWKLSSQLVNDHFGFDDTNNPTTLKRNAIWDALTCVLPEKTVFVEMFTTEPRCLAPDAWRWANATLEQEHLPDWTKSVMMGERMSALTADCAVQAATCLFTLFKRTVNDSNPKTWEKLCPKSPQPHNLVLTNMFFGEDILFCLNNPEHTHTLHLVNLCAEFHFNFSSGKECRNLNTGHGKMQLIKLSKQTDKEKILLLAKVLSPMWKTTKTAEM